MLKIYMRVRLACLTGIHNKKQDNSCWLFRFIFFTIPKHICMYVYVHCIHHALLRAFLLSPDCANVHGACTRPPSTAETAKIRLGTDAVISEGGGIGTIHYVQTTKFDMRLQTLPVTVQLSHFACAYAPSMRMHTANATRIF